MSLPSLFGFRPRAGQARRPGFRRPEFRRPGSRRPGSRRPGSRRPGFTLMELMVVLLLVGVVMSGFSMMSNRTSPQVVHETASRFLSGYQAARAEAIASGRYAVVQFWFTAADADSGWGGRYLAAPMRRATDNPATLTTDGRMSRAAWNRLAEGVVMDPGSAVEGPIPGSAATAGVQRTVISCQTVCDLGGDSYVTYYFRPSDDPSLVYAVVISQSGQGRLYRWRPSAPAGESKWE